MAFVTSGTLRFSTSSGSTRSINNQLGFSSTQSNSSLDSRHDLLFDWGTKPNWTSGNPSKFSEFYGASDVGGCCIIEGTRVTLWDGTAKNVEDLKIGDRLLSYKIENLDENADEDEALSGFAETNLKGLLKTETKLTSIASTKNPNIIRVNDHLSATDYDIVLMYKKDGDPYGNHEGNNLWLWLPLQALEVGDKVIGKNFQEVQVSKVESLRNKEMKRTFTLDCEPYDWYYASGILIHNKGPGGGC